MPKHLPFYDDIVKTFSFRQPSYLQQPSCRQPSYQQQPSSWKPSCQQQPSSWQPSCQQKPSCQQPSCQQQPSCRQPSSPLQEPSCQQPGQLRKLRLRKEQTGDIRSMLVLSSFNSPRLFFCAKILSMFIATSMPNATFYNNVMFQ